MRRKISVSEGFLDGIPFSGNYGGLMQRPSGVNGILIGHPMSSTHQSFPFVHEVVAGKLVVQEAETH